MDEEPADMAEGGYLAGEHMNGHRLDDPGWAASVDARANRQIYEHDRSEWKQDDELEEDDEEEAAPRWQRAGKRAMHALHVGIVPFRFSRLLPENASTARSTMVQLHCEPRQFERHDYVAPRYGEESKRVYKLNPNLVNTGLFEVIAACSAGTSGAWWSAEASALFPIPLFTRTFEALACHVLLVDSDRLDNEIKRRARADGRAEFRAMDARAAELLQAGARTDGERTEVFAWFSELLRLYMRAVAREAERRMCTAAVANAPLDAAAEVEAQKDPTGLYVRWVTSPLVVRVFGGERFAHLARFFDHRWLEGLTLEPDREHGTASELDQLYEAFEARPMDFFAPETMPEIVSRANNRRAAPLSFERAAQLMADLDRLGEADVSERLLALYVECALRELEERDRHVHVRVSTLEAYIREYDVRGALAQRWYRVATWRGRAAMAPHETYLRHSNAGAVGWLAIPQNWLGDGLRTKLLQALETMQRRSDRPIVVHSPHMSFFSAEAYVGGALDAEALCIYSRDSYEAEAALLRGLHELYKGAARANEAGPLRFRPPQDAPPLEVCSEQMAFLELLGYRADGRHQNPADAVLVLNGAGGSGKSYTIAQIRAVMGADADQRIAVVTYQNNAAAALKRQNPLMRVETVTRAVFVHSSTCPNKALCCYKGLPVETDGLLSERLREGLDGANACVYDPVEVLVVDEGGLMDPKAFATFLGLMVRCSHLRVVVFMGDYRQMPPLSIGNLMVSFSESCTMLEYFHSHRFGTGALARFTMAVRDYNPAGLVFDNDAVCFVAADYNTWRGALVRVVERFGLHYGNCTFITHTNADKDAIETLLRAMFMYGADALPAEAVPGTIDSGQRVVCTRTDPGLRLVKNMELRFLALWHVMLDTTRRREARDAWSNDGDYQRQALAHGLEQQSELHTMGVLEDAGTVLFERTTEALAMRAGLAGRFIDAPGVDLASARERPAAGDVPECAYSCVYPNPLLPPEREPHTGTPVFLPSDCVPPGILRAIVEDHKVELETAHSASYPLHSISGVIPRSGSEKRQYTTPAGRRAATYPIAVCAPVEESDSPCPSVDFDILVYVPLGGKYRRSLRAAGCCTVHMKQSMQTLTAVLYLTSVKALARFLTNSFVYTAVTRGIRRVVIVGSLAVLHEAVLRRDQPRISDWTRMIARLRAYWHARSCFGHADYERPAAMEIAEGARFGARPTSLAHLRDRAARAALERAQQRADTAGAIEVLRKRSARNSELDQLLRACYEDAEQYDREFDDDGSFFTAELPDARRVKTES